jgi:hypothetical protein
VVQLVFTTSSALSAAFAAIWGICRLLWGVATGVNAGGSVQATGFFSYFESGTSIAKA